MDDRREPRGSRDRDRSWREIDKKRDGSKHRSDERPARPGKKQAVTGLARYKGDLGRLFEHGAASAKLRAVAAQRGMKLGADQPERQAALRAILDAAGSEAIGKAVDAFAARFGELPDDPQVLMQALDHPDEHAAGAALRRLRDYVAGRQPPRRTLLLQRVKAIETRAESDEIRDLASRVRELLGA